MASWRRGSRSRGCGDALQLQRGPLYPHPARATQDCATSVGGTSGLRSSGLREGERGQGAQRLGRARTRIHRTATHKTISSNPLPREIRKHNTPTGNNQECQSGAEGQVAQKEPHWTGPGENPHSQLGMGRNPMKPRPSPKSCCPLLSCPNFSAAPIPADPTSGK